MEAVVENRVVHGKSGNSVGKSFSTARICLWYFLTRPRSQVYLSAAPPLSNLESILFGAIWGIVDAHPNTFKHFTRKRLFLGRSPDSFLMGLTIPSSGTSAERIAKFSGKHASDGILMAFDESSAVPNECFQGAATCASDDKSRILAIYNPHYRSGECYRAEVEGRAKIVELSALNHPQVVKGRDDITPGAVTRDITVLRINNMTRPMTDGDLEDSSCFEVPEYLVGCTCLNEKGDTLPPLPRGKRKITVPAFSTVVLGQYPSTTDDQLISQEWIDLSRSKFDMWVAEHGEVPPEGVGPVCGFDLAEMGNDLSCLTIRFGSYVMPLISWQGLDVPSSVDRCVHELKKRDIKPSRICCDTTGLGSASAPGLVRLGYRGISCKVASSPTQKTELGEFGHLRDQLLWEVREALRLGNLWVPNDPDLLEELLTPTFSIDRGKIHIMRKKNMKTLLKRSPDKLDSLALSFFDTELLFPNL